MKSQKYLSTRDLTQSASLLNPVSLKHISSGFEDNPKRISPVNKSKNSKRKSNNLDAEQEQQNYKVKNKNFDQEYKKISAKRTAVGLPTYNNLSGRPDVKASQVSEIFHFNESVLAPYDHSSIIDQTNNELDEKQLRKFQKNKLKKKKTKCQKKYKKIIITGLIIVAALIVVIILLIIAKSLDYI